MSISACKGTMKTYNFQIFSKKSTFPANGMMPLTGKV